MTGRYQALIRLTEAKIIGADHRIKEHQQVPQKARLCLMHSQFSAKLGTTIASVDAEIRVLFIVVFTKSLLTKDRVEEPFTHIGASVCCNYWLKV